jgi:ABC-type branched-subunit amino acid transport system ATPase component
MSKPCLAVRNLSKHYRGVRAVDDVSFDVTEGSITGLIGPNGSGKSTTIDCISGFTRADGGNWKLDGRALNGLSAHQHSTAGLVRTFQTVRVYEAMSLLDNLCMAIVAKQGIGMLGSLYRSHAASRADAEARHKAMELLKVIGLEAYAEAPASILSYGQRKLLSIASTMMSNPRLVILDEPVAGINPTMILRVADAIRKLNEAGITILLCEHNMDLVMRLCDHIVVLANGRLLATGAPHEIQSNREVLDAYLGPDFSPVRS